MRHAASFLLALGLLGSVAAGADAQLRMPGRYQARPLTLPHATLRPEVALGLTAIDGAPDVWTLGGGLGIGVIDDLELGALLLPLRLHPNADYLNPQVYARLRFLRGQVEIGVEGRAWLPVAGRGAVGVGLPILVHAGRVVRLDFGPYLGTDLEDALDLSFPFAIAFQVSNPFFLGLETGVDVRLRPGADTVGVPAGAFFGWTFGAGRDPVADLMWGARMVDLRGGLDVWQAWIAARFYAYL